MENKPLSDRLSSFIFPLHPHTPGEIKQQPPFASTYKKQLTFALLLSDENKTRKH